MYLNQVWRWDFNDARDGTGVQGSTGRAAVLEATIGPSLTAHPALVGTHLGS